MTKRYCIYCGKIVKTESTRGKPFPMRIAKCKNCDGWFQYDIISPPIWEKT